MFDLGLLDLSFCLNRFGCGEINFQSCQPLPYFSGGRGGASSKSTPHTPTLPLPSHHITNPPSTGHNCT